MFGKPWYCSSDVCSRVPMTVFQDQQAPLKTFLLFPFSRLLLMWMATWYFPASVFCSVKSKCRGVQRRLFWWTDRAISRWTILPYKSRMSSLDRSIDALQRSASTLHRLILPSSLWMRRIFTSICLQILHFWFVYSEDITSFIPHVSPTQRALEQGWRNGPHFQSLQANISWSK
jgi:hypothetical protein